MVNKELEVLKYCDQKIGVLNLGGGKRSLSACKWLDVLLLDKTLFMKMNSSYFYHPH